MFDDDDETEIVDEFVVCGSKFEQSKISSRVFVCHCVDCNEKIAINKSFVCQQCTTHGKYLVCAFCASSNHHFHKIDRYLPIKLREICSSSLIHLSNQLDNSPLSNSVLEEYGKIYEELKRGFSSGTDLISSSSSVQNAVRQSIMCEEYSKQFEEINERMIPSLRLANAKLEDLLHTLQSLHIKSLPSVSMSSLSPPLSTHSLTNQLAIGYVYCPHRINVGPLIIFCILLIFGFLISHIWNLVTSYF